VHEPRKVTRTANQGRARTCDAAVMAGWATVSHGLGARLIRFAREPLSGRIVARRESVRGVQWIVLPLVLWRTVVRSSSGCLRCRER